MKKTGTKGRKGRRERPPDMLQSSPDMHLTSPDMLLTLPDTIRQVSDTTRHAPDTTRHHQTGPEMHQTPPDMCIIMGTKKTSWLCWQRCTAHSWVVTRTKLDRFLVQKSATPINPFLGSTHTHKTPFLPKMVLYGPKKFLGSNRFNSIGSCSPKNLYAAPKHPFVGLRWIISPWGNFRYPFIASFPFFATFPPHIQVKMWTGKHSHLIYDLHNFLSPLGLVCNMNFSLFTPKMTTFQHHFSISMYFRPQDF